MALRLEAALPACERGPEDFCALRRLALICAREGISLGSMMVPFGSRIRGRDSDLRA